MDKNKLKRIEDEVIGMTMEIVGMVWGMEMVRKGWTEDDKRFFNRRTAEVRNDALDKIRKIYLRKTKVLT